MQTLSVNLAGVTLKNPVILASGTAAYGQELAQKLDLNKLGSIVIKSTTQAPRQGNPWPVTVETKGGWMNGVGLTNPGIDHVLKYELPWLAEKFPELPIIGSVAGFSVDEYVTVAQKMASAPNVKLLEINISCPNVDHGGLEFGTDPETVYQLTKKIAAAVDMPFFMKLTPNVTDIRPIAKAAEDGGADGLTMINTLKGMEIDLKTRKPHLSNGTGGLSGAAIHPLAVRMIHEVRQETALPIIGVGGVFDADDALEMKLAGANAVEMGAATYGDPQASIKLIEKLPNRMQELGLVW